MPVSNTFYFNPHARGLAVFLGATEEQLMTLLWERGTLSAKTIAVLLGDNNKRAYTTLTTVLDKLTRKGHLSRKKEGRHFVYTPVATRERFLSERVKLLRACIDSNFKGIK
jgi:predicted transcriptional regulator